VTVVRVGRRLVRFAVVSSRRPSALAGVEEGDDLSTPSGMPAVSEAAPRGRIVAVVLNPFLNDTRVLKQARSLRAAGHEVHVVAVWKPGLAVEDEVDGLPVHRVRLSSAAVLGMPQVLLAGRSPRLRRLLEARSSAWRDATPLAAADGSGGAASTSSRNDLGRRRIRGLWRARRAVRVIVSTLRRTARRLLSPEALYPTRQIGMSLDLAGRILELEPDVVHCHDLNTVVAGHLVRRVLDCPVVYDSHELWLERNLAGRSRFWDRLQWGFVERRLIGRCAAVSTVAEGIARHLEARYGLAKVELIRNVQPFTPPASKSHLLADELGIEHDRRIALYAGGILRHRGIENLIRAARLASDRIAWIVMGYATQPAYLEDLKALAAAEGVLGNRVHFRDAVPPDAVNEYAASSDIAVVPTEAICLSYEFEASNKIFHSVMARVPVAMSDHIEKRLINDRHGIGVLFDETDPADIARTVEAFLDDRVRYDATVEACGRAADILNWEHEERTLLSMFDRVTRQRGTAAAR
jgi:glycosyltransferase involved in cell wall biosynthesis